MTTGSEQSTPATEQDRAALARCDECWSDGEGVDIGRAALNRLADLGWIEKLDHRVWGVSPEGMAVLQQMEAADAR
jgi:ribosomal protein S19E (S16A)